jgi:hypothetical protein
LTSWGGFLPMDTAFKFTLVPPFGGASFPS